jgi:hypothetical protein
VTRRQELEERVSRLEYRDRKAELPAAERAELAEAKADLAALGGA